MRRLIGILAVIAGAAIFFEPEAAGFVSGAVSQMEIKGFVETAAPADASGEAGADIRDELYDEISAYNDSLFENGQEINDAWTYAQAPFGISSLDGTLFGYISIPAMGVELPLYVGASEECLAKGACVMGGTSLPIGGENTNAVIAGHRGYRGIPFFRDIEDLAVGDSVYVTNRWETLTYQVEEIRIVNPDETDEILIQAGRDMVTLLTCHPYRGHGKYRYLVYCVRDGETAASDTGTGITGTAGEDITVSDGTAFEGSGNRIRQERYIRILCGLAILTVLALCLLPKKRGKDAGPGDDKREK